MTKDKLKELFAVECTETDGKGVTVIKGTPMDIINWINDKLDQETQRIKAELAYKDKEIEISHNENRRMERHFLETVTVINSLRELQTEDLKQLQSELTELKEKHKRDVCLIEDCDAIAKTNYRLCPKHLKEAHDRGFDDSNK